MGKIGIITEQGFVEGSGLGFEPVRESELHKNNEETENNDKEKDENK